MMTFGDEFRSKRVLVTGGTRGIGAAIAQRFSMAGAAVAITARSLPGGSAPGGMLGIEADLGTPAGVASVTERLESEWGGVDVLVNNLGAYRLDRTSDAPDGFYTALFNSEGRASHL